MENFPFAQEKKETSRTLADKAFEELFQNRKLFQSLTTKICQANYSGEIPPLEIIRKAILLQIGENYVSDEKGKKSEIMETFEKIVDDFILENKQKVANLMNIYEKEIVPLIKKKKNQKNGGKQENGQNSLGYFDNMMAASGQKEPKKEP